MINFTLYRKEIEILELVKHLFQQGFYLGGYRESIDELFYENDRHFRQEFLMIIPVEKLENIKELLYFLKTVNSSSHKGNHDTIGAMYRQDRNVDDVIKNITELQELIRTQCNELFQFCVFYSWQSDIESKYNRNFIEEALKQTIKGVNKLINQGPLLSLDKDTRGVAGSPDIVTTILQKIDKSVCFVADVTPITKENGKKIPNPNVMFELGYAISTLGFERVIIICNTAYCNLNELPFDLGLKRIIHYDYDDKTKPEEMKEVKNALASSLVDAIKLVASY